MLKGEFLDIEVLATSLDNTPITNDESQVSLSFAISSPEGQSSISFFIVTVTSQVTQGTAVPVNILRVTYKLFHVQNPVCLDVLVDLVSDSFERINMTYIKKGNRSACPELSTLEFRSNLIMAIAEVQFL